MANTSAIWQQAAHTTYHLPAAQQELYNNKKRQIFEFSAKKSREWTISRKMSRQKQREDLQKKTREEIGKGNQMTAPRFQTGG